MIGSIAPPREQLPPSSRYVVILRLAAGGMATVYLGMLRGAAGFAKTVAIKRAHPQFAFDDEHRKRIGREAELAALVRHPNVVSVLDVEDLEGELLTVLEYVEAAPLIAMSESPNWTPAIACRIVLDAAIGLRAVHDATGPDGKNLGILHRDISPQNILVGLDGISRITDFGIAATALSPRLTAEGAIVGKRAYMAPEYYESGHASVQSEIFSLSTVLWELLTGRGLFHAQGDEILWRRLHSEVAPPSTFAEIPRGLDEFVMKGLNPEPLKRYSNVDEFIIALTRVTDACGIVASHADVKKVAEEVAGEEMRARRLRFQNAREQMDRGVAEPSRRISDQPTSTLATKRAVEAQSEEFEPTRSIGSAKAAAIFGFALATLLSIWFFGRGRLFDKTQTTPAPSVPSVASVAPPEHTTSIAQPAIPDVSVVATSGSKPTEIKKPVTFPKFGAHPTVRTTDPDRPPPNPYKP